MQDQKFGIHAHVKINSSGLLIQTGCLIVQQFIAKAWKQDFPKVGFLLYFKKSQEYKIGIPVVLTQTITVWHCIFLPVNTHRLLQKLNQLGFQLQASLQYSQSSPAPVTPKASTSCPHFTASQHELSLAATSVLALPCAVLGSLICSDSFCEFFLLGWTEYHRQKSKG